MTSILTNCALIIGVIIALGQLWLARKSLKADHERRKKQSTIEFYHKIFESPMKLRGEIKDVFGDDHINVTDARYKDNEGLKKSITSYLSLMERFATGINMEVYDLNAFTRIAGKANADTFKRLFPIVEERRKTLSNPNLYKEFERLTENIAKERERIYPDPGKDRGKIEHS
ncbi:MAG: DUF4760 domain-containing protein [Prevotella sp.]|nr:DUF4760 domain-containing protein [Prevotella sp.]